MRTYFMFLLLIIQLFAQSSFTAAEYSDEQSAPKRDIQIVIEEYRQNAQQTMENFAAPSKIRAAWYENARLHMGCSGVAGLAAYAFAQHYIFKPLIIEAGSLWCEGWRWLLDCDQNNPSHESQCSYAFYASLTSWVPVAFYVSYKYRGPAQDWAEHKAKNLTQNLIREKVRRRAIQRFQALELEDTERLRIQDRSSQELRSRAEEIHQFDDETRKSIFQIASWVGDVSLMRAVLKTDDPDEALIIALLNNLDVCPICWQSFNERAVDAVVVRGCDARHCFHKSCLKNWYESSGAPTCPLCLDKGKPNAQELFDCLNRGIQSEIRAFPQTAVQINSSMDEGR